MKRMLFPLLAAALILCGCHAEPEETTPLPTDPASTILYAPDSTIEEHTQGAVQAYDLSAYQPTDILFFGDQLLVLTTDPQVELTTVLALSGTQPQITRQVTLDCPVYADEMTVSADGKTLAYYNPMENSIVLLDQSLSETRRIQLPDQVADRPLLTVDLRTLYYTAGSEIYALDMERGLPRLLKQHSYAQQSLTALHFDDSLLEVFLTRESGQSVVAFISAENGQTVGTDSALLALSSQDGRYLLQRLDGTITETLIGMPDQPAQALSLEGGEEAYPAFTLNTLATVQNSRVRLYDADTGLLTAQTDLGQGVQVLQVLSDPADQILWLRVIDQQSGKPLLLRWDVTASQAAGDTPIFHPRYTASQPDTEGLAACQQQADAIGEITGVTITVHGEFPQPQGYEVIPEHQVDALQDGLASLEQTLGLLPKEFLTGLGAVNQSGPVRIVLVRQILDMSGNPSSDMGGLHFVSAGNHYILLTLDSQLEQCLLHQLCHVLDAYVYAHTPSYDLWDSLNPKGFAYTGSYTAQADPDDTNLQGQTQCFVSDYGMRFAREDRAELFVAAIAEGNDALLSLPGLQNKLRYMCTAIRQAYGWQKTELTLPWEQYLKGE